jgi:hypothetical protein
MAMEAMLKRMAAVVKTPSPEKVILIATALEPKSTHKKAVKVPAAKDNSLLDG